MKCQVCSCKIKSKPGVNSNFHRHLRVCYVYYFIKLVFACMCSMYTLIALFIFLSPIVRCPIHNIFLRLEFGVKVRVLHYALCLFQTNHGEMYTASKKTTLSCSKGKQQTTLNFSVKEATSNASRCYNSPCARQVELTEAITNLIADSMLPLQLFETHGFRKFMQVVDDKYVTPSCRTVARRLTESVADIICHTKSELQQVMAAGNTIYFTIDLWSSRAIEPIAGIRMHYFNENFEMKINKKDGYRQQNVRQRQKLISIIDYDVCILEYLQQFWRYSPSKNGLTLKSGYGVLQGH